MKKPLVSIARNENIGLAVNQCLDQIEFPDLTGKNVLLKPNVGREAAPRIAINTNPDVVEAVFTYLKNRFTAKFFIGDSPIINTDTNKAFEQSGYADLLKNEELHFINLDDKSPLEMDIPDGKILKKIKLTGYLNEMDYIISLPVLKFHMHCGASLSFKNLKGLIYKKNKRNLHHLRAPELIEQMGASGIKVKELDIAISDLSRVIKPDLAIIDASIAMEGMGPSSGNPVKMDTIIASKNFLAADMIALALTQPDWTLKDVPHLKFISELIPNAPKTRKDVDTIPQNIDEFVKLLKGPPTSITIKYNNVNLVDIDSCSACLSTIFTLLKNNKDYIDEHFTPEKPLNLAIGKGIKKSDLYEDTFLIGNCSALQKEHAIFVQGCAPIESQIMKAIRHKIRLESDTK